MTEKQLIHYEAIRCKVHWKYVMLKNDFEDIKITELEREVGHCYGSKQYIMRFIEMLKHRIIRLLPDLSEVKIMLGVFDKNNMFHRLMVGAYYLISNILKREIGRKNFYKTIITIIKYKGEVVFIGDISFDGID